MQTGDQVGALGTQGHQKQEQLKMVINWFKVIVWKLKSIANLTDSFDDMDLYFDRIVSNQ